MPALGWASPDEPRLLLPSLSKTTPQRQIDAGHPQILAIFSPSESFTFLCYSPWMFKDCPPSLPCITSTAVLPVSSVWARCGGPFQPCFAHTLSHTTQGRKDAALSGSYTWRLLGAKQDCLQRAGKGSPSHSPGSHMLWHRTPQGISVLQKVP